MTLRIGRFPIALRIGRSLGGVLLALGLALPAPARAGEPRVPAPGGAIGSDLDLDLGPGFDRALAQDLVADAIRKSATPQFDDARTRLLQSAERAALAGDALLLDAMLTAPAWDQPMAEAEPRDLPFDPTWEGAAPAPTEGALAVSGVRLDFLRDRLQQMRDSLEQPGGWALVRTREALLGLADQLTYAEGLHPDVVRAVALKRRFRLLELLQTLAYLNGLKRGTGETTGFLSQEPGQALAQLESYGQRRRLGGGAAARAGRERDAFLQLPGVPATGGDFWDRRWPLLRDLQEEAREIREAQGVWRRSVIALDAQDDAMHERMDSQNYQKYMHGGGREQTAAYQNLQAAQARLLDVLFRNALLAQDITVENPRAAFSFLGGTIEKPLWEVLIEREADPDGSQRAIDQAIERLEENVRREIERIGDTWDAGTLLNELFSPLYAPDLRLLVEELSPILPDVATWVFRARAAWFDRAENREIRGAVFQSLKTGFLVAGGIFFPVGGSLLSVGVSGVEWYLSAEALDEARQRLGAGGAVRGSALVEFEDAVSASIAGVFIDSVLLPLDLWPLRAAIQEARAAARARQAAGAAPDVARATPDVARATPDAARATPDVARATPVRPSGPGSDFGPASPFGDIGPAQTPGAGGIAPPHTPNTGDFLLGGIDAEGRPLFGAPGAPSARGSRPATLFDAEGRPVLGGPGTPGRSEAPTFLPDGSPPPPPPAPLLSPAGLDLEHALDQARRSGEAGALQGQRFEVLPFDPDGTRIPFQVGSYIAPGGTGQILVAEAADGTAIGVVKFFRSRKASVIEDVPGIEAAYGQLGGYYLLRDTFGADRYLGPRILGWNFSGDTPIMLLERFPGDPALQRQLTAEGFSSVDEIPVGQSWTAATDRPWPRAEQEPSIRLDMELSENDIVWEDGHPDNRLHVRTSEGIVTVPGEQDRFFRAGSDAPRHERLRHYVEQRIGFTNLAATDATRFEEMLKDADGFRRLEWEGRGYVTPVQVGTTADGTRVNGFVGGRYDMDLVSRYDPAYQPIATDASGRTIYGLRNGHYRLDELTNWEDGITPLPPRQTGFLMDDAPAPGFGPFGGFGSGGAFAAAGASAFALGAVVGGEWVDWTLGPEEETLFVQGMAPVSLGSTSEGREFSSNVRLDGGGVGYLGLPTLRLPAPASLPEGLFLRPTLRLWGGSASVDVSSEDPDLPDTNFDLRGDGSIFGLGLDLDVASPECPLIGRLSYGFALGDFDLERSPCPPLSMGGFCESEIHAELERHAFGAQLGLPVSRFTVWAGLGYSHDDLENDIEVHRLLPTTPSPLRVVNRIDQTLERHEVEGLVGLDARFGRIGARLETRFNGSDATATFQLVLGLPLPGR